jgi:hypothetical protein
VPRLHTASFKALISNNSPSSPSWVQWTVYVVEILSFFMSLKLLARLPARLLYAPFRPFSPHYDDSLHTDCTRNADHRKASLRFMARAGPAQRSVCQRDLPAAGLCAPLVPFSRAVGGPQRKAGQFPDRSIDEVWGVGAAVSWPNRHCISAQQRAAFFPITSGLSARRSDAAVARWGLKICTFTICATKAPAAC